MKILLQVLLLIALTLCIGCNSYPERIEKEPMTCFQARCCMHSNLKNHDKSSCVILLNSCSKIAEKIDEKNLLD